MDDLEPRRVESIYRQIDAGEAERDQMPAEVAKQNWIQLRLADPGLGGLTVVPEDGDLFSLSKKIVSRLGILASQIEQFEVQVKLLRQELDAWVADHAESIREVFVVLKGDYFLFLVIMKDKAYDDALESALTELDIRIAQNSDLNLINLSVQALPAFEESAIRSFLPSGLETKGGS